MKKAVYAGTFDPFTTGHEHILSQAAPLFDVVILAIGENPDKKTRYSLDDRIAFLKDVATEYPNVVVGTFSNKYLVRYAEEQGVQYIIRGLRNPTDFGYEFGMYQINQRMNPEIQTTFFMSKDKFAQTSSSLVKGLIGPEGWIIEVRPLIPDAMWERFLQLELTTRYGWNA